MISDGALWWAGGYFDSRGRVYTRSNQVVIGLVDKERQLVECFARSTGTDPGWIRNKAGQYELMLTAMSEAARLVRTISPYVVGEETRGKLLKAAKFLAGKGFTGAPD
jgi:hypothetical protein